MSPKKFQVKLIEDTREVSFEKKVNDFLDSLYPDERVSCELQYQMSDRKYSVLITYTKRI